MASDEKGRTEEYSNLREENNIPLGDNADFEKEND